MIPEGAAHLCSYNPSISGTSIVPEPDNTRTRVLENARLAVTQDRQNTYGTPEQNFQTIANLWNAYWNAVLKVRDKESNFFRPHDVAIFLDLVKTARLVTSPAHFDNWVDKAGYSACGAECAKAGAP